MSRSFPATSGEQDSEEVAALVPEEKGDLAAAASAGPPWPSLSAVLRTRGVVASTMAGLVFLALLVGFGRWIKLQHDWWQATRNGFKDSSIPKQCLYRYKIYVEGNAWSVSEKYILACDSPVLFVVTPFQDILSRGLVAGKHYWPISRDHICESIKFAVDWGNEHPVEAQLIGEQGSRFAREEMSMDYVYDYMLHLLTEYAKLLRYKPTVPEKAVEICTQSMVCPAQGLHRNCMMDSMERQAADLDPCTLPPPFATAHAKEMADREEELLRSIQKMEKEHAVRP